MEACSGYISEEEMITKRPFYSHEQYMQLIVESGEPLSHDYGTQSIDEDPRMIAFFDSLIQRVNSGWFSDESSDDESPMDEILMQLSREWGDDNDSDASIPRVADLRRLFRSNRRILMDELERAIESVTPDNRILRQVLTEERLSLLNDEETSSGTDSDIQERGQLEPESTESIRSLFQERDHSPPGVITDHSMTRSTSRNEPSVDRDVEGLSTSLPCQNGAPFKHTEHLEAMMPCCNSEPERNDIKKPGTCATKGSIKEVNDTMPLAGNVLSSISNCNCRPDNQNSHSQDDSILADDKTTFVKTEVCSKGLYTSTVNRKDKEPSSCASMCQDSQDHCRCCDECERKLSMHWNSRENLNVGASSKTGGKDYEKPISSKDIVEPVCSNLHNNWLEHLLDKEDGNWHAASNNKGTLDDCNGVLCECSDEAIQGSFVSAEGTDSQKRTIDSDIDSSSALLQECVVENSGCDPGIPICRQNIDNSYLDAKQKDTDDKKNTTNSVTLNLLEKGAANETFGDDDETSRREGYERFENRKGCRERKYRKRFDP